MTGKKLEKSQSELRQFLDRFNQAPKLILSAIAKKEAVKEMAGSDKDKVRRFILETLSFGDQPDLDLINSAFSFPENKLLKILDELEAKDLIVKNGKEIIAAYPFSREATDYFVTLSNGCGAYCLCAIDALGVPFMVNQSCVVNSYCSYCRQPIELTVVENKITDQQPEDLCVFLPETKICAGSVAKVACPLINFFCSRDHLYKWRQESKEAGYFLTVTQALFVADFIFRDYLAN